jgi:hypothetical protein
MTMWLTTPDVLAELDRLIAEELREMLVREGKIPDDGTPVGPKNPEVGRE